MSKGEIGRRVRTALAEAFDDGRPDKVIAADLGMTPDAFSRAVNGERAFSALELAKVAELAQADVHFLITGSPDPNRVVFAARHDFDPETGQRQVPGKLDDEQTLEAVKLAYVQTQLDLLSDGDVAGSDAAAGEAGPVELPGDAAALRLLLGPNFVRTFADRAEEALGVDVMRIQGLSTDYSFALGSRRVILLRAQSNWFRSNYSLAHELAHLALGHHDVTSPASTAEVAANQFASDLLLPVEDMQSINWQAIDEERLARKVWEWGVSTRALEIRISALRLPVSPEVMAALRQPTQRLLRRHPEAIDDPRSISVSMGGFSLVSVLDPISTRMRESAERRIPAGLIKAHLDGIADGRLGKGTLAWLLETPIQELEVDEPLFAQETSIDDLAADLGFVGS